MSIVVTFAVLEQAAADVRALNAHIDNLLQQLKRDISPVAESWTGETREKYLVRQAEWNSGADSLKQALEGIAKGLHGAAVAYRETEAANARVWG